MNLKCHRVYKYKVLLKFPLPPKYLKLIVKRLRILEIDELRTGLRIKSKVIFPESWESSKRDG